MLYRPDVCNCTMPYVHPTVPAVCRTGPCLDSYRWKSIKTCTKIGLGGWGPKFDFGKLPHVLMPEHCRVVEYLVCSSFLATASLLSAPSAAVGASVPQVYTVHTSVTFCTSGKHISAIVCTSGKYISATVCTSSKHISDSVDIRLHRHQDTGQGVPRRAGKPEAV